VKKKVVVLVSNDLSFDRRVEKTCELWIHAGWDVELVGVKKPNSHPITRGYNTKRLRTLFSKGAGFYAVLQIRLFFHLLFKKTNVVWSNDLDTLLSARLICALRGIDLIYDSHEWFTEAEGLTGRPFIKSVWKGVERLCIPGLQRCLTVNTSIAEIYRGLYGVNMQVVRNVPTKWNRDTVVSHIPLQPGPKIILQGAYIDPDRGGEELVKAMQYLPDVTLYVIGSGRAIPEMKTMASSNVVFMDRLPYQELMSITSRCDLGLSLDKPKHENYRLSLPNKLFDYWQAGIPVLASPMVEVERAMRQHQAGQILQDWEPQIMAAQISAMLSSPEYSNWKNNAIVAGSKEIWENEVRVIQNWISELSR
jgi:glycosyltransferase involved in cell wall biosynthesis